MTTPKNSLTPDEVTQAILSFTTDKVMQVVSGIKEKLGLSDMVFAPTAPQSSAAAPAAAVAEEKTEFSIFLTGFGEGRKIDIMKAIKKITSLPMPEFKKMIDALGSTPYEVKSNIPKAEADQIKKELEEAGGIVEIK